MSEQTRAFLIKLGEDPNTLAEFRRDAGAVMAEHGVPEAHQQLILSGDKQKLIDVAGLDEDEARFLIV